MIDLILNTPPDSTSLIKKRLLKVETRIIYSWDYRDLFRTISNGAFSMEPVEEIVNSI